MITTNLEKYGIAIKFGYFHTACILRIKYNEENVIKDIMQNEINTTHLLSVSSSSLIESRHISHSQREMWNHPTSLFLAFIQREHN